MTAERTYKASQLSLHLGVKSGMVRRYHLAYERVTGETLPRDPNNNGRLVNDQQLQVLTRARELVKANPMLSVEDAIKSVLGLATVPTAPVSPQSEVLEAIARELRALRERDKHREKLLQALEAENLALKDQLKALPPTHPPSDAAPPKRSWWRWWGRR
jgi:hypothetical protein